MENKTWSFLTVGKTVEQKNGYFKRYVGLGLSDVIALNPTKKQLEEIYGRDVQNDPVYTGTDEQTGVKWVRFDFVVATVPDFCNGIKLISHASFTLRNEKYANRDGSKVRVLDAYGNSTWMNAADVESHKQPTLASGGSAKIAQYRIAYKGEPELIDFLRKYLSIPDAFEYVNGSWLLKKMKHLSELTKEEAEKDDTLVYENHMLAFDKTDFEAFFKGDTSALWSVIEEKKKSQNLGVTLLYGVRTSSEGKQYQAICTGFDMILYKNPSAKAIAQLGTNLAKAKESGLYSNTDYRVQELQEYDVQPTNLEQAPSTETSASDDFSAIFGSVPAPF